MCLYLFFVQTHTHMHAHNHTQCLVSLMYLEGNAFLVLLGSIDWDISKSDDFQWGQNQNETKLLYHHDSQSSRYSGSRSHCAEVQT